MNTHRCPNKKTMTEDKCVRFTVLEVLENVVRGKNPGDVGASDKVVVGDPERRVD